jgi:hypothetical protein
MTYPCHDINSPRKTHQRTISGLAGAFALREALRYNPETGVFTRVDERARHVVAGCVHAGYVVIKIGRVGYRAHRLAWLYVYGEWPSGQIDHINGVPTDNRLSNLRVANPRENAQNRRSARKDNASGIMGVRLQKGRWRARINVDGKSVSLGMFSTAQEAGDAYLAAKREHHTFCTI